MRTVVTTLIVGLAIVALPALAKTPHGPHVLPATQPGLLPDMAVGNPKAAITVVEYASAACPHCAHWRQDVWPQFEKKYVTTGKVHFIFREMLTAPQDYALSAFLLGRCAVNRSANPRDATPYFTVVDSFFSGQTEYAKTRMISKITAEVTAKTGMSQADIQACIADQKPFSDLMTTIRTHSDADDVHSTPTFFVNGKKVKGHELSDLDAAIAEATKK